MHKSYQCKSLNIIKNLYQQHPTNTKVINNYINIAIKLGEFSIAKQLINKHYPAQLAKIRNDGHRKCPINLHIGVHKTATTYVQHTLHINTELLDKKELGYIPLEEIRANLRMQLDSFPAYCQMLESLFTPYIKEITSKLIFSEENLINSPNMLIDHIYGHAKYRLNIIQFYFSEIYDCPINKVIITLRSYDSFFQSFFLENNRHQFKKLSTLNKSLMLNFSWKTWLDNIIQTFGKNNIKVLFFEDVIKNEKLIFDELTDNPLLFSQLIKSSHKRKSPNYRAYQEVEKLYSSDLQEYTKDFLRRCLMYPDLLQETLEKAGEYNSDTKKIADNVISDLHTQKLANNLLFTKEEVSYLRNKYQVDRQAIKDTYHKTTKLDQKNFIFICGHHRSGTSLLHRIVRDHPAVCGFSNTGVPEDEGQHLQETYPAAKEFGGPGKYIFHSNSYMDENHELATEESAQTIFNDWLTHYQDKAQYYVEKSPPNLIRTRFLQKLFPNSRFVVIMRHPIAVAYATQKWSKTPILDLIEHTLLGYEIFMADSPHLKQKFILKYENLIEDLDVQTRNLFDFLELDPITTKQEVKSAINSKYFNMWKSDIESATILMDSKLHGIERRMRSFGYSLPSF